MPSIAAIFSAQYRATTILAIAVLIGGGYLLANLLRPQSTRIQNAWYIDEQSGNVALNPEDAIVRPATDIPPLLNKDGQSTVVRAIFVTCGIKDDHRLAYLEKYTAKAQDAFAQVRSGQTPLIPWFLVTTQNGHLVRSPQPGSPWVPISSAEGVAVLSAIQCPDGRPRYWAPPN